MRRAGYACRSRHIHDLQCPRYPAHIHDIGLDDVDGVHANHAFPGCQIPVLFSASDVEIECIGDELGFRELPVRAGLLVMADAFRLQQSPDFDGSPRRKAAVRIHEFRHVVAERARHLRHDRLRPAGPFIHVPAALRPDAPLERVEALLVAQPHEPLGFLLGSNVAPH